MFGLTPSQEKALLMYTKGYYGYHPDSDAHIEESGKIYVGSDYAGMVVQDVLFLDRVDRTEGSISLDYFRHALPEEANPN